MHDFFVSLADASVRRVPVVTVGRQHDPGLEEDREVERRPVQENLAEPVIGQCLRPLCPALQEDVEPIDYP
eukprot:12930030-Prorocentrum_lima.AAC.1